MYESPIKIIESTMDSIYKDIVKKKDDAIFAEIQHSFGVDVDRQELVRALQYDRNQYEKGYWDGMADAKAELLRCECCKYAEKDGIHQASLKCTRFRTGEFTHRMQPDDFCSYGERREGE